MATFDYLIVGAGLFGSVMGCELSKRGKKCLVIDRRGHIGGNIYTEKIEGINVHKYGAHIFHTSNKKVWDYMNGFAEFNHYVNSPIAYCKGNIFNLPFNMNTFNKMWGAKTPKEAQSIIEKQRLESGISNPQNLEEQAIFLAGRDIYEKFIKGYTEKQWGRSCKELPAFIIKRLPFRFMYDNNYYNDPYQGIPIGGYTPIIEKMLENCEIKLNTDYFAFQKNNSGIAERTIFTGAIDEFFAYQYGELEYRSLRFENEILDVENFQGNAVVNYTEAEIPWTRIIEHKHFEFGKQKKTVITKEYPQSWHKEQEAYYPINDDRNNAVYMKYKALADKNDSVIFGGRLGNYKYFDMDQTVDAALITLSTSSSVIA